MITLHDYQTVTCRSVWRSLNRCKSTLLVAPTGSGKTVMGSFLLKALQEHKQYDSVIFAHRREIVKQTEAKLSECGLSTGVIMAGEIRADWRTVQVASIDSYNQWVKRGKIAALTPKIVWLDEAHRGLSPTYLKTIKDMMAAGAQLLGTTATPIRSDGKGLGKLFEEMVEAPNMAELIRMGFLVPPSYYVGIIPDVSGVKLTAGDYNQSQLQDVLDQQLLIGDIIRNWEKHSRNRPTLVFASGVKHSMHLTEKFKEVGARAFHIDGTTSNKVRDEAQRDLHNGQLDVICNANVYVEGTDIPPVACIIDAQPTKSLGRYIQKGGRGARTYPGKQDFHYHDHSGNVYAHGRLEMVREWELCEGYEVQEKAKAARNNAVHEKPCQRCGFLFAGQFCPRCGNERKREGKEKEYLPADLVKMSNETYDNIERVPSPIDKREWYAMALAYAKALNKSEGWAFHCFEDKFKEHPPREHPRLVEPSESVKKYMRSHLIRFAKRTGASRAQTQ